MQHGCRQWKANGSQPWLSPVLREQDDRGIKTRLLWSWVSKRDEGGMKVGLFMGLRVGPLFHSLYFWCVDWSCVDWTEK